MLEYNVFEPHKSSWVNRWVIVDNFPVFRYAVQRAPLVWWVQLLWMCCQVWCYDTETSLVSSIVFFFFCNAQFIIFTSFHLYFIFFVKLCDEPCVTSFPPNSSRHCGRLLCHKCSIKEIPIIKFDLNKPVRVCDICFDVLTLGGVS